MPDLFAHVPPDLREQAEEIERELRQRERVYPRFVASGTLSQARADRQVAAMKAALATINALRHANA